MQSLGLLSFVTLVCGMVFLVFKWPKGIHVTFSGHAAKNIVTIIYYNLMLTVVMALLIAFTLFWFVPTFHLSVWFSVCIIMACVFEYIATLIPDVGGWKSKYHEAATWMSATFLLPPLVFIIFADSISIFGRIVAGIGLLVMLGIFGVALMRKKKQHYDMLLQIGYYASFFVSILVATYL